MNLSYKYAEDMNPRDTTKLVSLFCQLKLVMDLHITDFLTS